MSEMTYSVPSGSLNLTQSTLAQAHWCGQQVTRHTITILLTDNHFVVQ